MIFSIFLLFLFFYYNYSLNILIIQPSNHFYNRQEWEDDLIEYTLIELSQIDVYHYSLYHNYSYKRYYININDTLHPTWSKIFILDSLFENQSIFNYHYILLLDLDIFFIDYKESIEEKLKQWNTINNNNNNNNNNDNNKKESIVYMPYDTNEITNYLKHEYTNEYTLNVNTGFQLWKVTSRTKEIIYKWKLCTELYPGCEKWSFDWPFDQGAFNQFIRPQLEENELTIIPCDEANGFPIEYENYIIDHFGDKHDLGNHNCNGRYVAHFWEETKRYNHKKLEEFIKKKYFEQQLSEIKRYHTIVKEEQEQSNENINVNINQDECKSD